jgi:hypothetical protein
MNRNNRRIASLAACSLLMIAGCALKPSWHWEKAGASEQDYSTDLNQCKFATYPDTMGMVTNESVRRMFACMEGKGWSKVAN